MFIFRWGFVSVVYISVAQGKISLICLIDRDVSKWHVCTDIAERRRKAFWELFTIDCWHVSYLIFVIR